MEHLRNARQIAAGLLALFEAKGLHALAADVNAVGLRIKQAEQEILAGNIGR